MTKLWGLSLGSSDAGRLAGLMKCEHLAASFLAGCREACGRPDRLLRREPIVLEALNQDRRNGLICAFS